MTVKLLTEHYLEFEGESEAALVRLSLHVKISRTLLEITCRGSIIYSRAINWPIATQTPPLLAAAGS